MLTLAVGLALAGECPSEPALRDPDGEVTVLAQNLKFIITGTKRKERVEVLSEYLRGEGAGVDLLLLSEARLTSSFDALRPEWCFYTQLPGQQADGYRWAPIEAGRPPGGLAMGIRQRPEGEERMVGGEAGRRYRAKPTSLAEGFLGRVFGFRKGWAGLRIDDTHLVWSHTQASYKRRPEKGAGEGRSGRAGQFADLADDLGRPERATLITGDLNLLAGFEPRREEDEARVKRARAIDAETVDRFRERTGIDLAWPWNRPSTPSEELRIAAAAPAEAVLAADPGAALANPEIVPLEGGPVGTYAGGFDRRRTDATWDVGAPYDRVGVNEAFLARHPGTRVRRVEIAKGWMRVSDHLGLEIAIPFRPRPAPVAAAEQAPRAGASPRACAFTRPTPHLGRFTAAAQLGDDRRVVSDGVRGFGSRP